MTARRGHPSRPLENPGRGEEGNANLARSLDNERRSSLTPIAIAMGMGLLGCATGPSLLVSATVVELETAAAVGSPETTDRAKRVLEDPHSDSEVRCAALHALGRIRGKERAYGEALDWLRRVGRECSAHPRISSEALLEVARIVEAFAPRTVPRFLERVVILFPDEPAASRAVRMIASGVFDSDGIRRTVRRLWELHRRVQGREVAPVILWEAAALLSREKDRASRMEAIGLLLLLARRHPDSGLRDDALWAAGNLLLEEGDARGALECFLEIRAMRQWSFLFGSYDRPVHQDALSGMAEALRRLGRHEEASRVLEILARERPGGSLGRTRTGR